MGAYYSGYIDGDFNGFDEGNIYKLDNGSYWIQSEYEYDYMYEYNPYWFLVKKSKLNNCMMLSKVE